ncbi:MAG TPA: hypothetical protein VGC97_13830 [Pyrinomonadaceae bacterium]|jgi:hypothetical protein
MFASLPFSSIHKILAFVLIFAVHAAANEEDKSERNKTAHAKSG